MVKGFCSEKGIALFDTATEVRRLNDNASDKFLEVVTPTDIPALLAQIPECRAVVTTGQKATDVLLAACSPAGQGASRAPAALGTSRDPADFGDPAAPGFAGAGATAGIAAPPVGGCVPAVIAGRAVDFWRMPSTSRAYPLPLDRKADAYRHLFTALGLL
ncbi:MAG: uracil-DNA glycosylase family protein [Bacteroidales bacterium]|nr:uracil-DNA glycosylase family protein [Bacteroidales bacterium]MBR4479541.1 uracil-DNA glycosylase family protein [Bacteroidales bacterium]